MQLFLYRSHFSLQLRLDMLHLSNPAFNDSHPFQDRGHSLGLGLQLLDPMSSLRELLLICRAFGGYRGKLLAIEESIPLEFVS